MIAGDGEQDGFGSEEGLGNDQSREQVDQDDPFVKMLEKESFSDYREHILDESDLEAAYPDCNEERIRVEREL